LDKIIGLGTLGCAIAEELTAHPEYRVYKIDALTEERGSLALGLYADIAAYEEEIDAEEVAVYLRSIKPGDEVLLILEGGDAISGAALRILETIQESLISVLYVCPDTAMISETQRRDHKIVCGILQEYARSGALENVTLVSRPSVEVLVGDVAIDQYEQSIAYFISYVIAMINYFNHTTPIIPNTSQTKDHCRVCTYGVSSLDSKGGANLLFPLEDITDVHFYYGIPQEEAQTDTTLMGRIKTHTREYKNNDDMAVNFAVYTIETGDPIVLCAAYSNRVQLFPSV